MGNQEIVAIIFFLAISAITGYSAINVKKVAPVISRLYGSFGVEVRFLDKGEAILRVVFSLITILFAVGIILIMAGY